MIVQIMASPIQNCAAYVICQMQLFKTSEATIAFVYQEKYC